MTSPRAVPDKFLVAFSFAGEQRDLVRSIAEAVEQRLGRGTVFFDEWYLSYIAGDGGDLRLMNIYRKKANLAIPCISERYGGKPWTKTEHRAIRELQQKIDASKDELDQMRIMSLRVGDGEIEEIPTVTIVPDARTLGVAESVELIIDRLRRTCPGAGHRVFLAECPPELNDSTQPINRGKVKLFLEERGWFVVSEANLQEKSLLPTIEEQLQQCVAFVELLGKEPWSTSQAHLRDAAQKLIRKHVRFRSAELERSPDEVRHREQIFGRDVIVTSMDDFLKHLEKELNATLSQWQEPIPTKDESGSIPPLVRVAIRSSETQENEHWDQVFNWLYEQKQIRIRKLKLGESILDLQKTVRCHGFLIACDESTRSIDELMEQCELLQLSEKNSAQQLPVAVVFWPPPPAPPWSRLLNVQPPFRFHRLSGETLVSLNDFIADVRQVWQVTQ